MTGVWVLIHLNPKRNWLEVRIQTMGDDFPDEIAISESIYKIQDSCGVLWWDRALNSDDRIIGYCLYAAEMDPLLRSSDLLKARNVCFDQDLGVYRVLFPSSQSSEQIHQDVSMTMFTRLYKSRDGYMLLLGEEADAPFSSDLSFA